MIYGYSRVSTSQQSEEGQSLTVQERAIQGYCMQKDWTPDSIFIEKGISGSIPLNDRPEGKRLLDSLKAGDTVITCKLDRMFRSAVDALDTLEKFKALGVSLHMLDMGGDVTNGGISKLIFTILAAVAEAERDRLRERIRDVKRDQKKRGNYLGGAIPFGYVLQSDGQLFPDLIQQQAIADMRTWSIDSSLRDVSKQLFAEYGITLSHVAVARILRETPR